MVTAALLQHICNQFGGYRGPTLVLLVLSCIGKVRNDGGNAFRAGNLAGVNHDAELHERRIDVSMRGVHDIHIVLSNGLPNLHIRLADAVSSDLSLRQRDAQTERSLIR